MRTAWLLSLTACLGLVAGSITSETANAQGFEPALAATREQKKDLTPLIDLLSERIGLQMVEVEPKVIKQVIRGALSVQRTSKAMQRHEQELLRLIALDFGLKTQADQKVVSRMIADTYLKSPQGRELSLSTPSPGLNLVPRKSLTPDQKEELKELRGKTADLLAAMAYPPRRISAWHRRCIRHDKSVTQDMKPYLLPRVDQTQAKGMRFLASRYGPFLAEELGSKKGSELTKTLENTLTYGDTGIAMAATLVKLRGLVRPLIYAEQEIKGDPFSLLEAHGDVVDRVCTTMQTSAHWTQLRSDHAAMLRDPKAHTARVKAREK